jgi:hypothetical protein
VTEGHDVNRTGANVPGAGFFLNRYPVYTEGPIALGPYATGTHTINSADHG